MGSNNFDGPVLLESLALLRGYLGTGGRAGEDSIGPRVSGGVPADPNALLSAPQGSLHLAAGTLWQNTDGITAWAAVGGGGGSIAPITGLTFVDATFVGASDGSISAPFTTIQDALNAIGDATTLAEQFEGWKVIISAGFYDEGLVIPQRRSIVLDCAPGVILSDTTLTTARTITWAQNLAPLPGTPSESYGLQINNLIMVDGIELVSGGAAVLPNLELRLNQVTFFDTGVGTIPSISAVNLTVGDGIVELRDCLLRPLTAGLCFSAGTRRAYISYANSCEFTGPITALAYGQMVNCSFKENTINQADHTYTNQPAVGNLDRPEGFFGCEFQNANPHTVTMSVPADFRVDDVSWTSLSNNWTFVTAPIRTLSDPYILGNSAAGNLTWDPAPGLGAAHTLSNAIDRIAAAVSGLLAAPIP